MADKEFKGVIVPILTPLKPDETVDVPSLRRLVNYLIDSGVHGIWVSGTTGEFAQLTDGERIRSVEAVVDEVAGRVPVIGNVSGASTQLSISLALALQESGLDGMAVTPPYYYPNAQDELVDHYRHIRDRVGQPLWVYNIPQTVKTAVAPETVARLAREDVAIGIKDSSGAGELFAQLNVLCNQGNLKLYRFLGTAFRITSARSVGADGVIPGIANLIPAIVSKGWEAGESGDEDAIRDADAKIMVAQGISRLAKGGGPNAASFSGMKSALKIMGVIDDDTVSRPFRPFTEEEKKGIPPILKELGLKS
ncbi:MAG: dihydrodipicolinate synthase family protein [Chloroflexi bacterium]|nr:dihydrodipicolinate synthase family protein [Chloroflexota bacterium]